MRSGKIGVRSLVVTLFFAFAAFSSVCGKEGGGGTIVPVAAAEPTEASVQVETAVAGLEIPWEIAFSPDGRVFVTERPGRIRVYDSSFTLIGTQTVDVKAVGEGGLLGMALHPKFAENRLAYLYMTYQNGEGDIWNRVLRYEVIGNAFESGFAALDHLPGAGVHNGGRIKFGPDGKLYVAAGDSARKELAQDLESPAGKIHRINDDGTMPDDNPFPGSTVYSYGHRNPQGLAWDTKGRMYEAEHGPSGFDGPGGYDEANFILPGRNYGWPKYGIRNEPDLVDPLFLSEPAIAPSGCALYTGDAIPVWKGNLLLANLRGQHLRRIALDPKDPSKMNGDEVLFEKRFGRLRDVVQGPDGFLYLLTSNRDGRASGEFPTQEDDRVLRIRPIESGTSEQSE